LVELIRYYFLFVGAINCGQRILKSAKQNIWLFDRIDLNVYRHDHETVDNKSLLIDTDIDQSV